MYPIQKLIYNALGTTCKYKARKLLAERLGNKNRNKAYNLAERLLNDPVIRFEHAVRLHQALDIPKEVALEAARSAFLQCSEEHRQAYLNAMGPHLQVRTRGPVTWALAAAMLHQKVKVVRLPPEILQHPLSVQLHCAREAIRSHREKEWTNLPVFGEVLGFKYCPDTESLYELDLDGNLLQKSDHQPRAPEFNLTLSGRHYDWATVPSFL